MSEFKIDYSLLLNIIAIAIHPLFYWWTSHHKKKPSITYQIIRKQAEKEKEKLRAKLRMDIIDTDLDALNKIAKIEIDKTRSATETIQKELISEVVDETIAKSNKFTENLQDKLKVGKEYANSLLGKDKSKKDE